MAGIIIYGILIVIATAMIFMATWRLLFLGSHKEADPMAIDAFVARCKRGEGLVTRGQLGWLEPLIDVAIGELVLSRRSIEDFRRRVERFHSTLVVAANAAMGMGFLGTVVSMASTVSGNVDPVIIIGLGMQTTMVGLIIALPGTAFHGLTDNKVMRFLDQIDAVLEAVDGRINPPESPAMIAPLENDSPTNGRKGNGRFGSRPVADHGTGSTSTKSVRVLQSVRHDVADFAKEVVNATSEASHDDRENAQSRAVAMIASSSEFDEMVMDALSDGDNPK